MPDRKKRNMKEFTEIKDKKKKNDEGSYKNENREQLYRGDHRQEELI